MIFFTICAANFLGYASALHRTLKSFHPESDFFAVLCDEPSTVCHLNLPFPVINIIELGIPNIEKMVEEYNITELSTALKPFAFLYLFDRYKDTPVVYLDPDIMLFSPLLEVSEAFSAGAQCVLTPHICEPAEYAEMSDLKFIKYGIYNLGFCGMLGTENVIDVVSWWGRRLEEYCVIDLSNGIFVDQKWADYFPAFIPQTHIIRHPGYNVAYWNLSQRKLQLRESQWYVNNEKLAFFHFSGNKIEDHRIFSRHSSQFTPENTPVLKEILQQYRDTVMSNGHSTFSKIPYSYKWSGSKGVNEHTPETIS